MAEAKTFDQVQEIISHIRFREEQFVLTRKGDGFLLQLQYDEPNIYDPKE